MTSDNPRSVEEERIQPPAIAHLQLPAAGRDGVLQPEYGTEPVGQDLGSKLWEYWRILSKRRKLVALMTLGAVTIGGLMAVLEVPLYTSSVRLQIDKTAAKPLDTGEVRPFEGQDNDFLKTQFELLQSRSIAERVVSSLRLGDDATFLQPQGHSITEMIRGLFSGGTTREPTAASRNRKAASIVMERRSVRPLPGSRLVDVQYVDPDPNRAQRVATTIAESYIASNIDKRFEANAYAKTFLEDQTKQLQIRLEESEKVMLEFAQREKIVVTTEKVSAAESNLASANAALGSLISERIKNQQQWNQVEQANLINLPQLLTNAVVEGLRAQRNALTTEYQEKLETFKPDYPQMIQIRNKIGEINRQLASEVQTIKSSYKAAFEASSKQESEMRSEVERLKAEVLDLQQRSIQFNILKREVDTNRQLYDSLLQRYKQVDIAGGAGANNVFIIDKAEVAQFPSSPLILRSLAISLALGLLGGIGFAFVLEHLDNTIRTVDELERASGCVTLGIVPKAADDTLAELADPHSNLSEAYRSLATALQFSTDTGLPWCLMFTSAGPGEGKSTTAIATARHFAALGLKVLLVDSDLRNPSVHTKLTIGNSAGLSNVLTGAVQFADATQPSNLPNLVALTSGPVPPNPAELLGSARMPSLLRMASELYDLIVLDAPPVMGLADAAILSSLGCATVFVAAAGQARLATVRDALRRLQLARAQVLGAVLTKFDAKAAGYGYGYGYGYGASGYGYGYGGYGYGRQVAAPTKGRPPAVEAQKHP